MVRLNIDGRQVEVEEGKTILEAAEAAGITIPTLCYHKALLPHGACRLCVVEIEGRPRLAASCAYPVEEGIEVKTASPRVLKARKLTMELLLLRCPDVPKLKELAEQIGVDEAVLNRFRPDDEKCILCGLCARVCRERMGVGAIDFVNRGYKRKVSPPFGEFSPICVTCGACEVVCPTGAINLAEITKNKPRPIGSDYDVGLAQRPSIYIPFPQAIPKVAVIDRNTCMHFLKEVCKSCENFCDAKAIRYDQEDELIDLDVGAVILAPGYELFDPDLKKELGYGRYLNVISSLQFERILSASGPYMGKVVRPSDQMPPRKIAFIQCVGSRDTERNYCSTVCCMYATKEAIIAKEHEPELECHIFFIDMRAFGKGFEAYYERAKELGVKYTRCLPSSIKEVPGTKNLRIHHQKDDGEFISEEFDMVVLSTGLRPLADANNLAEKFGIQLDGYGFAATHSLSPAESSKPGIYVCGPFTGPKDIPETVMEASCAGSKAMVLLAEQRGTLTVRKEYPPEKDVSNQEPRIGVFVCHCGTNIGGGANIPEILEYVRTLPNVVHAEDNPYTCSTDTQAQIKTMIEEKNLNRVVVASCTPRTHEPLFRETCREAGLNEYLFEMANIRDQNTWVHMGRPEEATKKAKDLIRMALAKARLLEPLKKRTFPVNHTALVIGGGMSGMTAALNLAEQGFEAHLVERGKELGGHLRHVHYMLDRGDPQRQLAETIDRVLNHPKINVYTEAKVSSFEGFFGNFKSKISQNGSEKEIEHGAVIVAIGAEEYKPTGYLYGKSEEVVTQRELEEKLAKNEFAARRVVMIQCVGSRESDRPYCSRICCSQAVKNALKIKEIHPESDVFVLYRDIRTYGLNEEYYTQARQRGVRFIRYQEDHKPDVSSHNGRLCVSVRDSLLNTDLRIDCDLVVLSPAIVPMEGAEELAMMLKVPLTQDRFFLEAHMKLRPIDFQTDGIFICGLAHSPKSVDESIIQAGAAASRAATILSKDVIELEGTISEVVDDNCDGCAYCIDPCPFDALTLIEYIRDGAVKKTVEVDESACKGCGVCQATCPKQGIFVRGFKLDQLQAMVHAALEE